MPIPTTAYANHPELVGKITNPNESFFRTFSVASVFESKPELHWVLDLLHTDDIREASRAETLENHGDQDLWVFGYGSLMWDPAFHFKEVRRASVPGYARRFVLKDVYGGRGTPESPGLMAALDHGPSCNGLAFRISAEDVQTETEVLWRREMVGPGYIPTFVPVVLDDRLVTALTFVADHEADSIWPNLTRDEQIEFIASGTGFLGTSKEYLSNIVDQFAALEIVDDDCSSLLRAVNAYQSKD